MEMKEAIETIEIEERIDANIDLVFNTFLDERGFFRENVCDIPEGNDSFEGRLICPGHTLEALWFIMDTAHKRNKKDIVAKVIFKIFQKFCLKF
jgi:N-acylglucosamine 2-epimerase